MSSNESHRIAKAFLTSPNEGVVELSHDWKAQRLPLISLGGERDGLSKLEPIPACDFAFESRYYIDENSFGVFVFDPIKHPIFEYEELSIYLAGSFNGWQDAVGKAKWRMSRTQLEGREVYSLKLPLEMLTIEEAILFKFVTDQHYWIPADPDAPNFVSDD